MKFLSDKATKAVPDEIYREVQKNRYEYFLDLSDSVEESVKTYVIRHKLADNNVLTKAWYYSDFREFCPELYREKYMDTKKYPLYEGH